MDDIWLCVEEDSNSSYISVYSDNVDSEIESELYSMIHHQDNLSSINQPSEENSKDISTFEINDPLLLKDKICEKSEENGTSFICSFKDSSFSLNDKPKGVMFNIDKNSSRQNLHNLNMFLKPSLCDSQEDSQSTNMNLRNSTPLLNNKMHPSKKSNFLNPNLIKVESSSDSDDSILWLEPNNSFKNDMKINLFNSDISVSSHLDDSLIIPSTLQTKESNFKNSSQQKRKRKENSKDLWYINDEDLYRSKKKIQRYHDNIDSPQCSSWGKKNDFAKPWRISKAIKCFYCGDSHVASNCNKRICSKCYGTGHNSNYCWMNSISYCLHCHMKGHVKKNCPDMWRRYHLTTDPVKITPGVPVNQDRMVYCFNCGLSGHFGSECKEPRIIKSSYPTWPCVISYNNPDELLTKKFNNQRSKNNNIGQNNYGCKRQQDFVARRENSNKKNNINATQNVDDRKNICNQQADVIQNFVKGKNEKKAVDWEFFKQRQKNINRQRKTELKGKNFPRTPKNLMMSQDFTHALPEFMTLELKQILKRKKKNQKRRWKKYCQKFKGETTK